MDSYLVFYRTFLWISFLGIYFIQLVRFNVATSLHDISHAQFVVVAVLLWFEEHHENPTQIAIARLSKLDQMTVSKSLKKLIAQGYIKREESQKDTRAKWVYLTSQGKELASKLIPLVEDIDAEFFGKASHSEQQSLIQILGKLVADMDENTPTK
jgi:DNA-binding MarR family transcriptional regulator